MNENKSKTVENLNELTVEERELGTKPIGKLIPIYFLLMGALYDFMGPGGAALITFEIGKGNYGKA